jgi:hypothetical protein
VRTIETFPLLNHYMYGVSNSGSDMDSYKWFLLGMMAAWTPGMILLALMLMRDVVLRRPRLSEQFLRIDKWSICRG